MMMMMMKMYFVTSIFVINAVVASPVASPALSIITTSLGSKVPHIADYSGKVHVSVASILTQQEAAAATQKGFVHPRIPMGIRSVQNDPPNHQISSPTSLQHPPDSLYIGGIGTQSPFHSWSPPAIGQVQEFSPVDVHVFGDRISSSALNHLQPNLNRQKVAKLRVILGSDYDDAWMSPENPANRSLTGYFPRENDELMRELNQLNYTVVNGDRAVQLNPNSIALMKQWLLQKATCPIEYSWKDLGNRFWPQWIRHGVCKANTACSWPFGMKCQPSGNKTLKLLRWYCIKQTPEQERNRFRRRAFYQSRSRRSLFGSAGSAFVSNYHQPRAPPPFIANQQQQQQQEFEEMRGSRGRRQQDREVAGPDTPRRRFTRAERRSKRVKRLVRKLSRSFKGYYCEWSREQYTLQPDCKCQC